MSILNNILAKLSRRNPQSPLVFVGIVVTVFTILNVFSLSWTDSTPQHVRPPPLSPPSSPQQDRKPSRPPPVYAPPKTKGVWCPDAPGTIPQFNSTATARTGNLSEQQLAELKKYVGSTKGYYARDYSLGLGWNNMRYIIEAALLQARLLNRTLVLPSFIYARACELAIDVCAQYATMVNRGDAVGWDEWRELPTEKQMAWRIPIEVMLDIPLLRRYHKVVTVSEYLQIHGLDPRLETSSGLWDREKYHTPVATAASKSPSLHLITNDHFDPKPRHLIDSLKGVPKPTGSPNPALAQRLRLAVFRDGVVGWDAAKHIVGSKLSDEEAEEQLLQNGWATLYTWFGEQDEFLKAVVNPIREVVSVDTLKGFVETYDAVSSDVLLLEGETHNGRKPGFMRFSTASARDAFADMVLHTVHASPEIRHLGKTIANRMLEQVEGRMWMGAHMRRGDFVRYSWTISNDLHIHVKHVLAHFARGLKMLETIYTSGKITPFNVPQVEPDMSQVKLDRPKSTDPFFLATDEREAVNIEFLRDRGAILIHDLITVEDRREFGWPILLTDVLGVVEQHVLAESYFFAGYRMSSVAGGVMNLRAIRGADSRTYNVDL